MNNQYNKRSNYNNNNDNNKPTKSIQANLTPDEIKKKLEEYKLVDNINEVPIGTHIRYFTNDKKTGEKLFRLGGFLAQNAKDFITLSNNNNRWSVQKNNAIFYKKMSFTELKDELIRKISKKFEKEIEALAAENERLKETLKQVKKTVRKKSK